MTGRKDDKEHMYHKDSARYAIQEDYSSGDGSEIHIWEPAAPAHQESWKK